MTVFVFGLLGVRQEMLLHIQELRIVLVAYGTGMGLHTIVDHFVLLQVGPLHESLVATVALVRFQSAVQELVL